VAKEQAKPADSLKFQYHSLRTTGVVYGDENAVRRGVQLKKNLKKKGYFL
jgi:hypothetical protein